MGYRDDRDALRGRIESLEQDLASARAEVEKLRQESGEVVQQESGEVVPAGPAGSEAGARPALPWVVLTVATLLLMVAGVFMANPSSNGSYDATFPAVLVALAVLLFVVSLLILHCLEIARPNRVLVLFGRRYVAPNGSKVGYRVVRRGTVFRVPLVEDATTPGAWSPRRAATPRAGPRKGLRSAGLSAVSDQPHPGTSKYTYFPWETDTPNPASSVRQFAARLLGGFARSACQARQDETTLGLPRRANHLFSNKQGLAALSSRRRTAMSPREATLP